MTEESQSRAWCGDCHRRTRLSADGRRCQRCHPLAGRDEDPYRRRPWCGSCDRSDRMVRDSTGTHKCRRCHPLGRPPTRWPMHDVPEGYTEQLLACEWLCYISPTMRRIGGDELRVLLRLWFDHRWTPNDVVYALDHLPTGELQIGETPSPTADPRVARQWIRRRLGAWLDEDRTPLPPVNAQISGNRARILQAQEAAREQWRRLTAAAVPASESPGAAMARTVARTAAAMARQRAREADAREAARRREEVMRRSSAMVEWERLLDGLRGPD